MLQFRRKAGPHPALPHLARKAARQDGFDDIAMCGNPNRKPTIHGIPSLVDVEIRRQTRNEAGVWENRGTSSNGRELPEERLKPNGRTSYRIQLRWKNMPWWHRLRDKGGKGLKTLAKTVGPKSPLSR
jgi:hypothetical protein